MKASQKSDALQDDLFLEKQRTSVKEQHYQQQVRRVCSDPLARRCGARASSVSERASPPPSPSQAEDAAKLTAENRLLLSRIEVRSAYHPAHHPAHHSAHHRPAADSSRRRLSCAAVDLPNSAPPAPAQDMSGSVEQHKVDLERTRRENASLYARAKLMDERTEALKEFRLRESHARELIDAARAELEITTRLALE